MYDLPLLLKVTRAMHRTLDLNRRIYIILTCATAGGVFGFSRAFLLLVDKGAGRLEGKMGVGPASREDAIKIWSRMSQEKKSLEELLEEYERISSPESMPLAPLARELTISLSEENEPAVRCLKEKKTFKVTKEWRGGKFINILGTEEYVCIPLIVENKKPVGVLLADNRYSDRRISDDNVQSLSFFADQMAVALEESRFHQRMVENEQKLREAEKKLHRSYILASLGEMSASLAHEVKNPLVAIGGFARSIGKDIGKMEDSDLSDRIRKKTDAIVEETKRLENLLSETLDFARIHRSSSQLENVAEIIEEVCNLTENELVRKNIRLSRCTSPALKVQVDKDQIKQVLFNLIQNAMDSMPQGGELQIRTEQKGKFVRIEVADTGTGIPVDVKKKIFSPFFTTKTGGSGLGLPLVRQISEQHGGCVEVKSEKNKGTSVFVYLPLSQE